MKSKTLRPLPYVPSVHMGASYLAERFKIYRLRVRRQNRIDKRSRLHAEMASKIPAIMELRGYDRA
jgi:hypothetical protein